MKWTYDKLADAAYLYLTWRNRFQYVSKSFHCDPRAVGSIMNLDFDDAGRLMGIEILDASARVANAAHLKPKLLLDPEGGTAFINLTAGEIPSEAIRWYWCDEGEAAGVIGLALEPGGRLLGVEVRTPHRLLSKAALKRAELGRAFPR